MKYINNILIATGILLSCIIPIKAELTPQNTIIISDVDDVLIKKAPWYKVNLVVGGMAQHIRHSKKYINALIKVKHAYKKSGSDDSDDLRDENGNEINGLAFNFLYHGMRDPDLTPYTAWIVNTVESSRQFIQKVKTIYQYLKTKGYTIALATNKDRVSYDITTQAFGNEFTDLASRVFVAHPGNTDAVLNPIREFANQPTTPDSYKNLAHKALTIQPTNIIYHVPSKKPDLEYYHYVEKNLDHNKNMIFIDDKKRNSDGFNALQRNNSMLRQGIQFLNPEQLAEELVKIGILSETEDRTFLKKIRNPGIFGTIKLYGQKIKNSFINAFQNIKQKLTKSA